MSHDSTIYVEILWLRVSSTLDSIISNSLRLSGKLACFRLSVSERICTRKQSPTDGFMESYSSVN